MENSKKSRNMTLSIRKEIWVFKLKDYTTFLWYVRIDIILAEYIIQLNDKLL